MSHIKCSVVRPHRHRFHRDDESGLTTLEWLLIVAAVAGLAALAVVLVTNVVNDTSEQISGSDTRETAARLAADEIQQDIFYEARAAHAEIKANNSLTGDVDTRQTGAPNPNTKNGALQIKLAQLNQEYERKCENLGILYSDLGGTTFTWNPGMSHTINTFTAISGTHVVNGQTFQRAAQCVVSS